MNLSEDATYWAAQTSSIQVPAKLRLNTLDFALGIRADKINENFNLIKYWIEAERLRIGGWGIVEGFDMSKDLSNFTIHVDSGVIINEHGEEIHVDAWTSLPQPPRHTPMVEHHTVDENGVLILDFAPYSDIQKHTIEYTAHSTDTSFSDEIKIWAEDSGKRLKLIGDIQEIHQNIILLPNYAGEDVRVEYIYANDRIDGIFLKKDGSHYEYELGIISTSPSNQVVQDYFEQGYYLIGFAYWHIGTTIDVEFFTGDRTWRKVYVDRNNILYLNGKPYKEKTVIYFIQPNPPEENDLWYNVEEDILYIWRPDEHNVCRWIPVNDLSRSITSAYQFTPSENPDDLQTFDFSMHPELYFVPGMHQLTVIIDQIVIMEDQYDELYYDSSDIQISGYGIRLKNPLERPSVVEIRVIRNVNTSQKRIDAFTHKSLYGTSGYYIVSDPEEKIFDTKARFQCLESQIEVYKNGIRLIEGKHYRGILLNGNYATIENKRSDCDRFIIDLDLAVNDIIEYRVLRPVVAYSNLQALIDRYEGEVQQLTRQINTLEGRLTTFSNSINESCNRYETALTTHSNQISALEENKISKTEKIQAENLSEELRKWTIKNKSMFILPADDTTVFLPNASVNDLFIVGYKKPGEDTVVLIERADYDIVAAENGVEMHVDSQWTNDIVAKFYITILQLGV